MKQFPMTCSDDLIRATDGDDGRLAALWRRFPSLQREFVDYDNFVTFAKSLVDGRTATTKPAAVVSSKR